MSRKLVWIVGVLVGSLSCLFGFVVDDAYADARTYDFNKSVKNCLNAASSYRSIDSVKWACDAANEDGWPSDYNYCSLWLGANAGSITIKVDSATGEKTIYYYGMCVLPYQKESNGISSASVSNVNNSIGSITTFNRGTWNSPTSTPTKLDVGKFVFGVSGYDCEGGEYTCYKRTASIKRCNKVHTDSCSSMNQDIIVAVKKVTLTAYFRIADSDTTIKEYNTKTSKGSKSNSENFEAISYYNPNKVRPELKLTFNCWSTSNKTSDCVSYNTSYTTTRSDNKTIYGLYNRPVTTTEVTLTAYFRIADSDTTIKEYNTKTSKGSKSNSENFEAISYYNPNKVRPELKLTFNCWSTSNKTSDCVSYNTSYTTTRSDNKTIYGLYNRPVTTTEYVLTSEACTTSGTNLNKTNSSGSIQSGKTARVGKPSGVSNDYVFQGWVNNATDCIDASGKSYNTFTSASGMPEYVDGADFVVKSLKQNRVVYAMYEELEEEKYVNLKVYAVDDEGRYIGQSGSIVNNSSGADITGWFGSGNPITIPDMEQKSLSLIVGSIRSDNAEGMKYKFVGWAPYMPYPKSNTLDLAKRSCGSIINGELCTYEFYAMHEIDGDNANIYAVYKKNSVSGSTNAVRSDDGTMITNMPLVDTNTDRRKAQNCEPECEVKFVHRLKNEGNISTRWRVTRYSNYWDGTYGAYITSGNIEEGYLNGTAEKDVRTSGVYKLKPGMVVCETMHFKSLENLNDPETTTTACISAEGTVYAGLNILVSRNSGEYGKSVYAKPGDRLRYKVDYNSAPQYAYGLRPDRLGNIGSIKINEDNNSGASLGKTIIGAPSLFDTYKDKVPDLKSWNNAFYIWSSSDGLLHDRLKIDPGDILGKHLEYTGVDGIGYLVEDSYVGKALTTSAYTNVVDQSDINTTPNSVSFKDIDNKNTANVGVDRIGSEVKVIVPYNFTMTTEVLGKSSNIVYAGEEDGNIKYSVKVNKRTNGLVGSDDPYATKVPGAKAKLKVTNCEDDVYGVSNEVELGTLGKDYSKDVAGIVINIPDILAGSRICVYSMVWPGNSGPEDNIDTGNFGDWVVSEPKEFKVAKKPSFQVWGGGLFVNGNAKLPFAKKKYLEMEGYEVVSGEGK